jgi:hypothetical protein
VKQAIIGEVDMEEINKELEEDKRILEEQMEQTAGS